MADNETIKNLDEDNALKKKKKKIFGSMNHACQSKEEAAD